jgi:maleate isomerase
MIRVGVLSPHAAEGAEAEFPLMAPSHVRTTISRIRAAGSNRDAAAPPPGTADDLRALATHEAIDEAVAAFAPGSVDIIGYASTGTAYALGYKAEARLVERVSKRWAVPVCSTSMSAVEALRSFGTHRVALVHPPWFGAALSDLGVEYFRSQGFQVVASSLADVPNDPDLVAPRMVVDWIACHVGDDAEAVFIGGNGFRAAPAIDDLEKRLGRPVLESNQVLLWSILARAGASPVVRGFGTLFETPPQNRDGGR